MRYGCVCKQFSSYVSLSTGRCPVERQVSKEKCLQAAKAVGALVSKTRLDGGADSGMRGRPHGCTLHRSGNVEWWGHSDNAPCGNLDYDCVCKDVDMAFGYATTTTTTAVENRRLLVV